MKPENIFKRYDVRGKFPEELNEEFALRIGKSIGQLVLQNDRFKPEVVVCRDNKDTSIQVKKSFIKGVKSTGVDVMDAGVGPTDYAAFIGSEKNSVSIQVTSSHLPLEFNGLKFMYPEGNGFLNEDLSRIEQLFKNREFPEGTGDYSELEELRKDYFKSIKEYLETYGGSKDKKIVVDTVGGAANEFLPKLLKELGFEVVDIASGKEAEGPYYDPPNPKPEILEDIPEKVEEENADMALATDMDADRLSVYYDGRWLSGDELFFIFAQITGGEVVASVDSSQMLKKFSDELHYTRVGDPFVIDKAINVDADLAGEANGHYCFPDFVNYNSGTLAGLVLALTDVERYLENNPDLEVEKANIETDVKHEAMEMVEKRVKSSYELLSDKDGVKFKVGNSSVLVRPSGSSPVIRVKSESTDRTDASESLEEVEDLVRQCI